jgi:alanyl-tRNA synthetase
MTLAKKNQFAIPVRSSREVRQDFLDFFKGKAHLVLPSTTIAPQDDPTLLFTNAGMNQFKAIFLGDNRKKLTRVANSQKCLRVSGKHNDLDEVGLDGTHHTFFEMLGNWSFGDYSKKEAIVWAWELLTKVWLLPKNRLFISYHHEDLETKQLWLDHTDVVPSHVMPFVEENFWEMGAVGPCGPCSEIHFDSGDLATQEATFSDPVLGVNGKNPRYFEVWNLVFMQFERLADQSLRPLAATYVDTGMGLERICTVIQGKNSNYETDLFSGVIAKIAALSGVAYHPDDAGIPHRVIADHLRALTFAIADGVIPSNEGRGYVMRRILRRASRFAHSLGQKQPFIYQLVATLVAHMHEAYPEIKERQSSIEETIKGEEQRFLKTLDKGLHRINELLSKLAAKGGSTLPGEEMFLLHDTFGFPSDLTAQIAREKGFSVDEPGFERCMEQQQSRARDAATFTADFADESDWEIVTPGKETAFTGYQSLQENAKILRYIVRDDAVYVVLDKTPFYAEAGGQIGDRGRITAPGFALEISGTFKRWDMHIHRGQLRQGTIEKAAQASVQAEVESAARTLTMRNHTATHILHAALKQILGNHVSQQGSYVGPDRLRFDFTHHQGLSADELRRIEDFVNSAISENIPVATKIMPFDEAKASGAVAQFGEKYGSEVRVLAVGTVSREFCGGTHVQASGEIGLFRISQETSIAAGVRRIEALTSNEAFLQLRRESEVLASLVKQLQAKPEELSSKIGMLSERVKEAEKKLAAQHSLVVQQKLDAMIVEQRVAMGEYFSVVAKLDATIFGQDDVQKVLDYLVPRLGHGVAVLLHVDAEQMAMLVAVGQQAQTRVNAHALLQLLNGVAEGRGGGKADRARGGSRKPATADAVLGLARKELEKVLKNS